MQRTHTGRADETRTADCRLEVFIDGSCPLCRRETRWLRALDRGRGRIVLTDITDPAFDPSSLATTLESMMLRLHGRTSEGSIITGLEVFRRAYAAVGWGWLLAPTGWPVLRPSFDRMYRAFAAWRLQHSSGRCTPDTCSIEQRSSARPKAGGREGRAGDRTDVHSLS